MRRMLALLFLVVLLAVLTLAASYQPPNAVPDPIQYPNDPPKFRHLPTIYYL
jgi:hypothetical protein